MARKNGSKGDGTSSKKKTVAGASTRSQRPTLKVGLRSARLAAKADAIALPKETAAKKSPKTRGASSVSTKRKSSGDDNEARVRRLALAIAEAGLDKKAVNVEIIDVRGKVDYADYVIVMSGRSDRQVAALARHIEEHLKTTEKARCISVEGLPQGAWVLMDYGDLVVHIFHEDTRGYYDLESLWMDAARVSVGSQAESMS